MRYAKQIKEKITTELLLFIGAIIIAVGVFFALGIDKRITFCDEIYTYTIVNSDKPLRQFELGKWYTGDEVRNMLSQSSGDTILTMLSNIKEDNVHPPLYYLVVYLMAVLSFGSVSKWVGLLANLVFLIGTVVCIWKLIRHYFKQPWTAFVAVMIYLGNISTFSAMMLIRMYMGLTFWLALFVYANIAVFEDRAKRKDYILLIVATVGGFLTQYYFALFAVGFFVVEAIIRLKHKQYEAVKKYFLSMVIAVGCSTVLWPQWVVSVFGNTHSGAIFQRIVSLPALIKELLGGLEIMQVSIFQRGSAIGAIVVIVLIVAFFAIKKITDKHPSLKGMVSRCISAMVMYAIVVYIVTPEYLKSTRYFYAADFLEILVIIITVLAISELLSIKTLRPVLPLACVVMNAVIYFTGYGIDYYGDSQTQDEQREVLEQYAELPWIVCGGESWIVTTNLFDFMIPEYVMIIDEQCQYGEDEILSNADKILTIGYDVDMDISHQALYYYIGSTGNFITQEPLFRRNYLDYYIATPEN